MLTTELLVFFPVVFFTVYRMRVRLESNRRINLYISGATCILLFSGFVGTSLTLMSRSISLVYDPVLYKIEVLTGLILTPFTAFLLKIDIPCTGLFTPIYEYLTLAVIIAASSEVLFSEWTIKDNLITRFIAGALIGYFLYFIMPAVSPGVFFGAEFPFALPPPGGLPSHSVLFADGGVNPRNAMPSMHATWSILCFLALRKSPTWHRVLGVAYVLITFVSTIGFGAHYLVDWVVALPLVLLIRGMTVELPMRGLRLGALGAGAVLVALWVLAVRGAPDSLSYPEFVQLLVVASVALPVWLEIQIAAAQDRPSLVVSGNGLAVDYPVLLGD